LETLAEYFPCEALPEGRLHHFRIGVVANLKQNPVDQFRRSLHDLGALHERYRFRRIRR
jgi:hypothetical protein